MHTRMYACMHARMNTRTHPYKDTHARLVYAGKLLWLTHKAVCPGSLDTLLHYLFLTLSTIG